MDEQALEVIAFREFECDRMIGRRVETAAAANPQESDWKLSTSPDSLPASTTFVWDPISDQLIAMFEQHICPQRDALDATA